MSKCQTKHSFRSLAFGGGTPLKAYLTDCVVGTILTTINHGDAIIHGDYPHPLKVVLTYIVPFCVTTWGAITGKLTKSDSPCEGLLGQWQNFRVELF